VPGVAAPQVSEWRPRVSCRQADVDARRLVRRVTETFLSPPDAWRALEDLVGAKVAIQLRAASCGNRPSPFAGGVSIELAHLGDDGKVAILEVEAPLALALVSRAIKRPPPRLAGAMDPGDAAALAGALAALMAAVSRARSPGTPLGVCAAGPSADVLGAHPKSSPNAPSSLAATFDVSVDGERFLARLHLAPPVLTPSRPFDRRTLADLGPLPLEIPVVAMTTVATVADIAALEVGDAWMLGTAAAWARTLCGDVVLVAPGSESGARATLVEGGALVLRAGREELRQDPMPEDRAHDAVVEAVGDVPLVVRVEVGAARMTAREWADLGVGDVIGLAHKLADPVTLRVGGVEVAKGELVEIEGEVGVRILSRAR